MQLLYAWDMVGGGDLLEFAGRSLERRRISARYRPYALKLLKLVRDRLPEIDAALERHMTNWRLDRLAAVDRNILRLGAAELLFEPEVPSAVAIHEAIRLAEKYAGLESPAFVNGVLDAVFRDSGTARSSSRSVDAVR